MARKLFRSSLLWVLALAMGLAWAHLLEMPAKMRLDPELYVLLDRTLYPYFAYVGGIAEVLAVVGCLALCGLSRRRRQDLVLACLAAACAAAALGVWFAVVAPMNAEMSRWTTATIPADFTKVRDRWENGHAMRAVLWSASLFLASLVET